MLSLKRLLGLSLLCCHGAYVFAQESEVPKIDSYEAIPTHWVCTLKGVGNRVFDLVYHVSGKKVPCQVNYQSADSPGEIQVLWQAEVQRNYCEKMLMRRVEELRKQGWICES